MSLAPAPLILKGPVPRGLPVPAYPLPGRERERRPLYVLEREVWGQSRHGWWRVPRGYVTDFASIPALATIGTCLRLEPLGLWAWGALGHDWAYAAGEPGRKAIADDILRERMELDGVLGIDRFTIYQAVHLFGGAGYRSAPSWWDTANFADPDTGEYPVKPPFAREAAFAGGAWGLRPTPDWATLSEAA